MVKQHEPDQDFNSKYRKKIMKYNMLIKDLN
jgi:hypothetical protein